jgi:hypothetical protein
VKPSVGVLAFGSLIDDPGWELERAIVGRKYDVCTPFAVEFARASTKRGGAPSLVPVQTGGGPVIAQILLLNVAEQEAMDRLWRREIDKVGQGGHYRKYENPGPNTLVIDTHPNFEGIDVVLSARFAPTIVPLTPEHLAELAQRSARMHGTRRHYLFNACQAKPDCHTAVPRL